MPCRKFFTALIFKELNFPLCCRSLAPEDDVEMVVQSNEPDHQSNTLDTANHLEATIANQTAELVRVREALKKTCTTDELQILLLMNESDTFESIDSLLDRCADLLTFGALYKCQICFNGDMIFMKHGYTCNGMVDEWVKCSNFDEKPMRLKCIIPDELKAKSFFATCEPVVQHRAVRPLVVVQHDLELNNQTNSVEAAQSSVINKEARIMLKNGTAVDPTSRLEAVSHVLNTRGVLYTSVLALTDIQKNKNSYFKLQVLEADNDQIKKSFWLFTGWGRIGTDIGGTEVKAFKSSNLACKEFEKIFEEQTGNVWNSTDGFKKRPGKFYPIDVNYSDEVTMNTSIASKLSHEVEELMKLLFNVKAMKNTMREFKLDLEKMPLGKLSINQLQAAYFALVELEDSINGNSFQRELVGLSNKFYTLIPHSFGLGKAPILDTLDKINEKREMVDSLLDIEGAYAIMTQGAANKDTNSFDAYYKQLNADIKVLDPGCEEFQIIHNYAENTNAHGYKIELIEAFKVFRHGERVRFAQFKNLHNRKLLWHGSRITNFVSILANGMKIGPQVNGSMFGRGLYFADMISKSANYCKPDPPNNIALLALCEVALGNIQNGGANIGNLPKNVHSVQGVGITQPDPNQAFTREDGCVIPNRKANRDTRRGRLAVQRVHRLQRSASQYSIFSESQTRISSRSISFVTFNQFLLSFT